MSRIVSRKPAKFGTSLYVFAVVEREHPRIVRGVFLTKREANEWRRGNVRGPRDFRVINSTLFLYPSS